ncbi:MAG: DUF5723 family protein [Bacteroidota bacterium]
MRYDMRTLILLSCLLLGLQLHSQEQLGLRLERYSGVNSLHLNPANYLSSALTWDVNLAGVGVYGNTNYGYIRNTTVPEILSFLPNIDAAVNYNSETQFPPNTLIVDAYDNGKRKYASLGAIVMGPAVAIKLPSGHSFGLFTNLRAGFSAFNIPPELSHHVFDRTPFGQEIQIAPLSSSGMVWSEIGLNYAYRISTAAGSLDLGASVKFLNGYEAFFANSDAQVGITQFPGDTMTIAAPDVSFGFTNSNTSGEDMRANRNGRGLGLDLGMVLSLEDHDGESLWKFGLALLDIGRVRFSENAERHRVDTDRSFTFWEGEYSSAEEIDDAVQLFSNHALENASASRTGSEFNIWLPGALSLQVDRSLGKYLFLNATLLQRLPHRRNTLRRTNLLAISPRFEHRWFSAMLPLGLYNYRNFQLGASLRLGFLTLGSDNITPFFNRGDFTGADFYFALKVNPFQLGLDLRRRGKDVKCYDF